MFNLFAVGCSGGDSVLSPSNPVVAMPRCVEPAAFQLFFSLHAGHGVSSCGVMLLIIILYGRRLKAAQLAGVRRALCAGQAVRPRLGWAGQLRCIHFHAFPWFCTLLRLCVSSHRLQAQVCPRVCFRKYDIACGGYTCFPSIGRFLTLASTLHAIPQESV